MRTIFLIVRLNSHSIRNRVRNRPIRIPFRVWIFPFWFFEHIHERGNGKRCNLPRTAL